VGRTLAFVVALCLLVPIPAAGSTTLGRQVLRGINAERARHGLRPLRPAPSLRRVAGAHARYMARVRRLRHTSADGTSATRRIRRATHLRRTGEAIAFAASARALVRAWMASPPHRRLLLSRSFRVIGIGVARGSYRSYRVLYATADLGA
jgi:uncharacterized protein YkwD